MCNYLIRKKGVIFRNMGSFEISSNYCMGSQTTDSEDHSATANFSKM